jgi:hypothetical protein
MGRAVVTDDAQQQVTDDPETAQAKLDKLRAETRTEDATARKAEIDADVAAGDASYADSVLGRQQKDAVARKEIAVAEKEAAAARQDQLTALIPDLSKVKGSTLDVANEGPTIGGTSLTFGALGDAAEMIAEDVQTTLGLKGLLKSGATPKGAGTDQLPKEAWILVTSEPDLATSDGLYQEVANGLEQLDVACGEALRADDEQPEGAFAIAAPAIAVAAGALPHLISLLSAERAVRTATVTLTDIAASAAVAGALRARTPRLHVFHDDFRLVHDGRIYGGVSRLSASRRDLVARRILVSDEKTTAESKLPAAKDDEARLAKDVEDASKSPAKAPDELVQKLVRAKLLVGSLTKGVADAAVRMATIESLISSIDAFNSAIRVVPTGGRRTPLSTAALHELLHGNAIELTGGPEAQQTRPLASGISHVLLVKGQAGTAQQMTENRPLWARDKFSAIVDVSVTYILIQTTDSQVLDADTVTATATAHGDIGAKPTIDVELPKSHPIMSAGRPHRTERTSQAEWTGARLISDRGQ